MSVDPAITKQYYENVVSKDPTLKGKWVAVRGNEIIAIAESESRVADAAVKHLGSVREMSSVIIDLVGYENRVVQMGGAWLE